jgi:8-demethyl-8-alpha-L-rhamnosyltetracenomycin-C 2'-O-methyltransferase
MPGSALELELISLFARHGTDKGQNGYARTYSEIFAPYRSRPVRLLEIGIGTLTPGAESSMYGHDLPGYRPGASLRAWREYFPRAWVTGFDVQKDTQFSEERIETALCDSTRRTDVDGFFRSDQPIMDIVIDDGAHDAASQLSTLQNLWPHLRPGGVFVLEDIQPGSSLRTTLWASVLDVIGDAPYFVVDCPKSELMVAYKYSWREAGPRALDR